MPAYYGDSSALVKRYIQEMGSAWVISLSAPSSRNQIFTALASGVEIVAAISRRARTGMISAIDATAAITEVRHNFNGQYRIVLLTRTTAEQAMDLAERHGLRGYDAIQLASALMVRSELTAARILEFTFVSADDRLNSAAQAEGLAVENPNRHP